MILFFTWITDNCIEIQVIFQKIEGYKDLDDYMAQTSPGFYVKTPILD
jgi:hypothetical protein